MVVEPILAVIHQGFWLANDFPIATIPIVWIVFWLNFKVMDFDRVETAFGFNFLKPAKILPPWLPPDNYIDKS